MRKTIPEKTVEVCDLCGRDACLRTCQVCGRQLCLVCEGTVAGSWGFLDICRDCSDLDDVRALCAKYADKLTPIFQQRQEALRRLGKTILVTRTEPERRK